MVHPEPERHAAPARDAPVTGIDPFSVTRNQAILLEAVRRAETIARSDLTERTPLSQQSVHRLSEDLIGKGLLQVLPAEIRGRGKPSPRLGLRPDGAFGLGVTVDSGAAHLTACDLVGRVLHHASLDVDADDPAAVVDATHAAVARVLDDLALAPERIAGIGVSMQGFRRAPGTAFITPVPLSAWSDVDVVARFGRPRGLTVMAENDATLGAVAELWVGAGRRFADFVHLSFKYGFGGGIVVRGAPLLGHHMNAAEVSAIFDAEETRRRPALFSLLDMLREDGIDLASVSELRRAYDPTWPTLDRWVAHVAPALNQLLRALMAILDPGAIVFGGQAPADLRRRLMAVAERRAPDRLGRPVPSPTILLSTIGDDASALGAALLPIRTRLFAEAGGNLA